MFSGFVRNATVSNRFSISILSVRGRLNHNLQCHYAIIIRVIYLILYVYYILLRKIFLRTVTIHYIIKRHIFIRIQYIMFVLINMINYVLLQKSFKFILLC